MILKSTVHISVFANKLDIFVIIFPSSITQILNSYTKKLLINRALHMVDQFS